MMMQRKLGAVKMSDDKVKVCIRCGDDAIAFTDDGMCSSCERHFINWEKAKKSDAYDKKHKIGNYESLRGRKDE